MRSTLSPAFTGSKMRHMFSLIAHISNDYITQLKNSIKTEREVDLKDFSNKFANDVIAKCAFGINVNSLSDGDNEFFKMGQYITNFGPIQQLKFLGFSVFPKIMNVNISFY